MVLLGDNADLKAAARSDGGDILFTANDGITKLAHEIEVFDNTTGTLVAWVKLPLLSASADILLYVYYGNLSAVDQQSAADVWDSNFTAVYHLAEAAVLQFQDSSGSLNHATANNFDGDQSMNGQIGLGQQMDDEHLAIPAGATAGNDRFTFCLWINTNETGSDGTYWHRPSLFGQSTAGFTTDDFGITTDSGNLGMWTGLGAGGDDNVVTAQQISDQSWRYICAVNDSSNTTLLLDGSQVASLVSGGTMNGGSFSLGARGGEGGGDYHQGVFDEVQISSTDRSPSWIESSYRNQSMPGDFYTVGTQEVQ